MNIASTPYFITANAALKNRTSAPLMAQLVLPTMHTRMSEKTRRSHHRIP